MNSRIRSLALAATLFSLIGGASATVINPKQPVQGESQYSLSQQWWQWSLGIPAATNPITDSTGAYAGVNNSGSVYFLAGGTGGSIERHITVPQDKPLFFPILNNAYVATPQMEEACLIGGTLSVACAMEIISPGLNGATDLYARLDGRDLLHFSDIRQTSKEFFDVNLPEGNLFGLPAGTYPTVSDGFWLALKNLPEGSHTLEFGGTFADGGRLQVTDYLQVPEPGTLLTLVPGLLGLAAMRKRQKTALPT